MELTYGVELEHSCAINTSPGPGYEWMFREDYSNGKSDDESLHDFPIPEITWIDCRDEDETGARTVPNGDWHSEAADWNEEVVTQGDDHPREDVCRFADQEWYSEAPNWNEGALPQADWREEDSCRPASYGWDVEATKEVQKHVLRHNGLSCVTHGGIEYETWELKQDISLSAPLNICTASQDLRGKVKEGKENEWVLRGHELISPPLTAPNSLKYKTFSTSSGMLEIASYLNVVKGTPSDPWGAMINESCGFHVHVARSPPNGEKGSEMIPLPVLQHLALIIVRHEDMMSSLHPVGRRATWTKDPSGNFSAPNLMLGSNLMGFRRHAHLCQGLAQIDLEAAQKKIFAKNMTPRRLAYLMDTTYNNYPGRSSEIRYKFVNFQRLSMNVAKTIEFRQYEGTLDIDHVAHWVHFILSVVRAAERMAINNNPVSLQTPTAAAGPGQPRFAFPRQQGDKYTVRCTKLADEMENLFDLLDFEEETRIWWRNRFGELNPDAVKFIGKDQDGKERFVVTKEQCPPCRQDAQTAEVNSSYECGERWS